MIDLPDVPEGPQVNLRLDVQLGRPGPLQRGYVDLVVEVADVAQDGVVLHRLHVVERDDVLVAGRGDDDVGITNGLLDRHDVEALHQRLQRVDRVDLGDDDPGTLALDRLRAALTDVAVAADQDLLAADQGVGTTVDAVDQRVPGAVLVVELGLGHRVVDVDRREGQVTGRGELVQPQHAGGGLLGHALDRLGDLGPLGLVGLEAAAQNAQEDFPLRGVVVLGGRHHAGLLVLAAAQHHHGGIAAVVEDHVGRLRRARSASARPPTSTPRATRPSTRTPERPGVVRACRACRRPPRRPRGPGWRRCCRMPSGPRRRARSGSRSAPRSARSCAASPKCGPLSAAARPRIRGAATSGPASRTRPDRVLCARIRPATDRRP